MKDRLKHKLPLWAELNHLTLSNDELQRLKMLVEEWKNEFRSVVEINQNLCGIHHTLASSVYDNFFQIGLTESSLANETSLEQCEIEHEKITGSGIISGMKNREKLSNDINSPYNEKTYTVKNNLYYSHENLFDCIFARFRGKPTRIRLVKLAANTTVAPHIDYDPRYSVRVIIPIVSFPECVNLFWQNGIVKSFTMTEGTAYFLNTGYKHAVVNLSKADRYTLLISIDGIEDIKHLL